MISTSSTDTQIRRIQSDIRLLRLFIKEAPGKPPRPNLFWYEPTHRWRKKPEAGGSFDEKELHERVEKRLQSISDDIREYSSRADNKTTKDLLNEVQERLSDALSGKNTYSTILSSLGDAVDAEKEAPEMMSIRNDFWQLHHLVHEGEIENAPVVDFMPSQKGKIHITDKDIVKDIRSDLSDIGQIGKDAVGRFVSDNRDNKQHSRFWGDVRGYFEGMKSIGDGSTFIAALLSLKRLRSELDKNMSMTREFFVDDTDTLTSSVDSLISDLEGHLAEELSAPESTMTHSEYADNFIASEPVVAEKLNFDFVVGVEKYLRDLDMPDKLLEQLVQDGALTEDANEAVNQLNAMYSDAMSVYTSGVRDTIKFESALDALDDIGKQYDEYIESGVLPDSYPDHIFRKSLDVLSDYAEGLRRGVKLNLSLAKHGFSEDVFSLVNDLMLLHDAGSEPSLYEYDEYDDEDDDVSSAIYSYQGKGYADINENLRLNTPEKLTRKDKEIISDLRSAMSPLRSKQIFYRGIDENFLATESGAPVAEGDILTFRAFTSASRSPVVARDFMIENTPGIFIEIHADPSVRGITIEGEESIFFGDERETILDTDQKFQVSSSSTFVKNGVPHQFYVLTALPSSKK